MTTSRPFSQACENNKHPILSILQQLLNNPGEVLEIGSGTGQHACYFAEQLPHITWQPSDVPENLFGIRLWTEETALPNLKAPISLDINADPWPDGAYNAVFTSNTLHIMSWEEVQRLFNTLGNFLVPDTMLIIYGPFNYHGAYTSDSNAQFDCWLKSRDRNSGIRDIDAVKDLASKYSIELIDDYAMPANNRLLIWKKISTANH